MGENVVNESVAKNNVVDEKEVEAFMSSLFPGYETILNNSKPQVIEIRPARLGLGAKYVPHDAEQEKKIQEMKPIMGKQRRMNNPPKDIEAPSPKQQPKPAPPKRGNSFIDKILNSKKK